MESVIIKNGVILTMNEDDSTINSMLIEKGKIKELNLSPYEIERHKESQIIDLEGRTCLPGFHDSHMHMLLYGYNCKYCVDLSIAKSVKAVQKLLREFIEKNHIHEDEWVMGIGWNQENFQDEKRLLTREDLDKVSTKHYIVAKRVCIHTAAINGKLIEHCGITKESHGANNDIGWDKKGKPNGLIYENAINEVVLAKKPILSFTEIEAIILEAAHKLKALGLTSVQTDDMKMFWDFESKKNVIRAYDKLRREKKLPLRIFEQLQVSNIEELMELRTFLEDFKEDDSFSFSTVKLILDGSLGSCTAAMDIPYKSEPMSKGVLNFKDKELYEIVEYCYENDLQIMLHAIGSRAIEQANQVLEDMEKIYGKGHRPRIVHLQIATAKVLERIGRLNVIADIQPAFVASDFNLIGEKLTDLNRYALYSWNTMKKNGITISGSSDCPIESPAPLISIEYGVTRTNLDREPKGGWLPDEKLSVQEALQLFTTAPAYAAFMEEKLGQFKKGFYGDLVILDKNPLETEDYDIHSIAIRETVCFV